MKTLLGLLFFTIVCFPQHFNDLRGIETPSGETYLFYRILDNEYPWLTNSIYRYNPYNNQEERILEEVNSEVHKIIINDYEILNNNPFSFIFSKTVITSDTVTEIRDNNNLLLMSLPGNGEGIEVSRQDSNLIFVSIGGVVYRTIDYGMNWDSVTTGNIISVSPVNDSVLFVKNPAGLFKSRNRGNSFYLSYYSFYPGMRIQYNVSGNKLFTKTLHYYNHWEDNYLYSSDNSGEPGSWVSRNLTFRAFDLFVDPTKDSKIFIGLRKRVYNTSVSGEIIRSYDGSSFASFDTVDYYINGLYAKPGTDSLYASSSRHLYLTDGVNKRLLNSLPVNPAAFSYYPMESGTKWFYVDTTHSIGPGSANVYEYSIEITGDTVFSDGNIYKKFTRANSPATYSQTTYLRIDSTTGLIYEYNTTSNYSSIVNNLAMYPNEEYSMGEELVFYIKPGTEHVWNQERPSKEYRLLYNIGRWDIKLLKGVGLFSAYFSYDFVDGVTTLKGMILDGIVYGDTTVLTTDTDLPVTPVSYNLHQNYPNPFNPVTKIKFTLPSREFITLKVSDILGREIAILLNEEKEFGEHEVRFNAEELSSGIYIYSLQTENRILSRKMILLK
jgi:hypothetical protein